ncbi:VWA domain-containing protein [Prevotella sp. PCHR]|uniref:VWA domain-containing protein n=3 Tax=Xylanibacter caecicola TaxID=2736294 RepID=A0ABX2AZQ3_9BACT|nr:VWA domain-containing protein [Xylanibacter caecicola]NPE24744.1 VWA domain-containing protein [Xylanibacter caecicola]
MFRFESPAYLFLLLLIPLLATAYFIAMRNRMKRLRKFGDIQLLKMLMPDYSASRPMLKFILMLVALALIVVALARPQFGTKITNEKRSGIELVIALDISNSMLAEDVTPSRLDKSKLLVENIVDKFHNDKIALVVFAGDAFVQLPITSDYVSAKMFMNSITPSLITTQGTDIARAIDVSRHSFTKDENVGRAIMVITDGEDHEGGAVEAAKAAAKDGVNIFVVGVGSPGGSVIPDGSGGYIKDNTGQTVMSRINEDMCKEVAMAGGGLYINLDNTSSARDRLDAELGKLQKGDVSSVIYSEYDEQFQAFILLAIVVLILEICLLETKGRLFERLNVFSRKGNAAKILLALFMISVSSGVSAQSDRYDIRKGNRQYRMHDYEQAEVEYRKSVAHNPRNAQAVYNLGCALMMQQKDSAAIKMFLQSGQMEKNKLRKSMSFHNIGAIFQKNGIYSNAIEAYKEALRNNPSNDETRYNLVLCKRLQKTRPQKNGGGNNSQNDKNKDNKKDNKDKSDDKNQNKEEKRQDNKMSKENAERLLDAAIQNEKNTQQRLKKASAQPRSRRLQKNW